MRLLYGYTPLALECRLPVLEIRLFASLPAASRPFRVTGLRFAARFRKQLRIQPECLADNPENYVAMLWTECAHRADRGSYRRDGQ